MWKLITCRIKGHDWELIKSREVNPTSYEKFFVAIEVCKRCGRLKLAEEVLVDYRDVIISGNMLVAHKDFAKRRSDLVYRLIVG